MQLKRVDFEASGYTALAIECDTYHGGHFSQLIPWNQATTGLDALIEVIQAGGGVVHA